MLKLDHAVFPVWDAEASLAFYADTLDLPLAQVIDGEDWGGRAWMMLVFALAEGCELVLVSLRGARRPPPDGLARDVRHYAFSVETAPQLQMWRRKLSAAGVAFWEEDHGDQQSIYFEDPNGIVLEITTPASNARPAASGAALERARSWIAGAVALTG
jgi:glyoxylase I family protein